jgi:uncharacterized protein (TIGR03083 family)
MADESSVAGPGSGWARLGPPLDVRPLFAGDRGRLLTLLRSLRPDAWSRPTGCPGWDVHDLVSHVLHDHLRRLSGTRDRHAAWVLAEDDLARSLNDANEQFVVVARGLSPRLLIDLLDHLGPQLDAVWAEVRMDEAGVPVSWAAPDAAPVWLDVAREFSEFWVHHQQIRDAVDAPGNRPSEEVRAVVDTLVRSLPRALSTTPAPAGTAVTVRVEIEDGAAAVWTATKDAQGWRLDRGGRAHPDALIRLSADVCWRLATRGLRPVDALPRVTHDGDAELTAAALELLSIVR